LSQGRNGYHTQIERTLHKLEVWEPSVHRANSAEQT
jgi:hypothetical protein